MRPGAASQRLAVAEASERGAAEQLRGARGARALPRSQRRCMGAASGAVAPGSEDPPRG